MPRGDGTGPPQGPAQRSGRMQGNRRGAGPGGDCVCPACGEKAPHRQGTPCFDMKCPKCGIKMVRE
jgi:hypothetical protein